MKEALGITAVWQNGGFSAKFNGTSLIEFLCYEMPHHRQAIVGFAELTKGKTAVLISHRFSTVRMADRILVLKKGKLAEIGTHEELLLLNGLYAELFNLQADWWYK